MDESTVMDPSEKGRLRTGRVGLSSELGEGLQCVSTRGLWYNQTSAAHWKPSILIAPDMIDHTQEASGDRVEDYAQGLDG